MFSGFYLASGIDGEDCAIYGFGIKHRQVMTIFLLFGFEV